MQELQVPTRLIQIEIATSFGLSTRCELFVPDLSTRQAEAERVIELLNDDRRFLPLLIGEAHERVAVSKQHIVHVQLDSRADDLRRRADNQDRDRGDDDTAVVWPTTPPDTECRLRLANGENLAGMLVIDSEWNASRLIDKLNRATSFVALITARGVAFVNRDHIVQAE